MATKTTKKELVPHKATHPGVLIAEELEVRTDMNQKELANLLDVKPSFLNEIIKGKRPITAENALLLEKALGIPAESWMKMQAQYDLDLIRIKARTQEKIKNIEVWAAIKNLVPVSIFKKLGYIHSNISEDISKIFEIYNVTLLDDLIDYLAGKKTQLYRKSQKLTVDEMNLFAWSAIAEYECRNIQCKPFDAEKVDELCEKLNLIFFENKDTIAKTQSLLKEYGIKFHILEKFNKVPVDGYCFWSGDSPAIVVTKRHSRIDSFAFTLLHEIGHIVLHLNTNKSNQFLEIEADGENAFEKEADQFARNKLILPKAWSEINAECRSFSDASIVAQSKKHNINPRIIFGRMCFESGQWNVKTFIPSAIE